MPPWGHPLLIFVVLVASLWLMVIYRLVTILMIHWDVAGSSLVFLIAAANAIALKDPLSKAASMSRNTPSKQSFLAILRSIR